MLRVMLIKHALHCCQGLQRIPPISASLQQRFPR